mmetsp:Transcript_11755/g.11682  ORF Transcript_11755/g.11682 Transcript_11755/m.11682 type:complete len:211 (+) Transcript_11755:472-1104(+)
MHGRGHLTALDKTVYEGMFEDGKRHGAGRFFVQGGTYSLTTNFIDNKPEIEANQLQFKLIKNEAEEELAAQAKNEKGKKPDPKKDPKKGAQPHEEEKEEEGKLKIVYETGKENNFIEFELHILYQGPPYVDPNPPPPEEEKKSAPKGKGGKGAPAAQQQQEEPEVRMITPDPILMTNETGRLFEFELGRMEKFKKEREEGGEEQENQEEQ